MYSINYKSVLQIRQCTMSALVVARIFLHSQFTLAPLVVTVSGRFFAILLVHQKLNDSHLQGLWQINLLQPQFPKQYPRDRQTFLGNLSPLTPPNNSGNHAGVEWRAKSQCEYLERLAFLLFGILMLFACVCCF